MTRTAFALIAMSASPIKADIARVRLKVAPEADIFIAKRHASRTATKSMSCDILRLNLAMPCQIRRSWEPPRIFMCIDGNKLSLKHPPS